jgi:hypothetical protein
VQKILLVALETALDLVGAGLGRFVAQAQQQDGVHHAHSLVLGRLLAVVEPPKELLLENFGFSPADQVAVDDAQGLSQAGVVEVFDLVLGVVKEVFRNVGPAVVVLLTVQVEVVHLGLVDFAEVDLGSEVVEVAVPALLPAADHVVELAAHHGRDVGPALLPQLGH